MKSYSSSDIKYRMLTHLRDYSNWEKVLEDSAIDSILSANSEALSEIARYLEHLFRERTWNTAQNSSSIFEELKFFGYKPKRKISAIGYVTFSHDSKIADITSTSDLDDLSSYAGATITIPEETPLFLNNIAFITTETKTYSTGDKYLSIPVIQGSIQTITTSTQKTLGTPFEVLQFLSPNIESALDSVSEKFFTIQATPPASATITLEEVESIFLATQNQYAYELNTVMLEDPSDDYIEITFGNNVSGKILPKNSVISLRYLNSDGFSGNVSQKFVESGSLVLGGSSFLYTNTTGLLGGKDREEIEDIKINAPKSYLSQGAIVTEKQYKEAIETIPYVYKALVYGGLYLNPYTGRTDDVVYFSALNTEGETPEGVTLIEDVYDRLLNKKPPLDILVFTDPDYLEIAINYSAEIDPSINSDPIAVKDNIKTLLFDSYKIFNMDFEEPISLNEIPILVNNTFPSLVEKSDIFIEAKEYLATSTFTSSLDGVYYQKDFSFNPSFLSILDNNPYLMRIDFVWSCINCSYKDKTLFLLKNPQYDENDPLKPYFVVKQYPLITRIITQEYMSNDLPTEIVEGDEGYYPFVVDYDFTQPLKNSTLKIPLTYESTSYIDFPSHSPEVLDSEVAINVYAYPINWKGNSIYPITKNGIIKLLESDVKVEVS